MYEITTTPLTIFVSTALLCITEGLFFWAYWRLKNIPIHRENERLKKDSDFWRHRFDELAGQFLAYKRGGDALPNEATYEPGQPFQPFMPWEAVANKNAPTIDARPTIEVMFADTESYRIGETENYIVFKTDEPGLLHRQIIYKSENTSVIDRVGTIIMAVPYSDVTEYTAAIPKAKV